MTTLDVRLKYKFETGEFPTYGKTAAPQITGNYKGGITHEYAEWLEGSNTRKREKFHFATGLTPTFYDNSGTLRYTKEYKEWLEEMAVHKYWIIETFKAR